MLLLTKFNATKTPKKNDAKKFTIVVFWILNPLLILILSSINILNDNPKVLPNKITIIDTRSET